MMARFKIGLAALALTLGFAATPAVAQFQQVGLVNVGIGDIETGDILSNNRVPISVAANIAANVCGVTAQVGVVAQQVAKTGSFRCENENTNQFAVITR